MREKLFTVNNTTLEQHHGHYSGFFIVDFEQGFPLSKAAKNSKKFFDRLLNTCNSCKIKKPD